MNLTWSVGTHPGRVRSNNEDRLHPLSAGRGKSLLAAVADGMGGAVGGEVASRLAIEAATKSGDLTVTERVSIANEAVYEESLHNPDLAGMGTTLTLAEIGDGMLRLGHVGDSRCYRFREDELTLLTHDHTMAYEQLEAGTITADEATQHPQRHVLTRALGLLPVIDVDSSEEPLEKGDRFLLCSDGVNGMLGDTKIQEILGRGTPEEAVWELIEEANLAGGYDNVTVVIVDVDA